MLFAISLLYILFARIVRGQGDYSVPVYCPGANPYPRYYPNILFITQTSSPIANSWEAVIVPLDYYYWKWQPTIIGFDFDVPVEVYIEIGGTRTKLKYQYFNENEIAASPSYLISRFKSHYIFDNQGQHLGIFKIFVRNAFNDTTPHLTVLEDTDFGINDCLVLKKVPYEMIENYKVNITNTGAYLVKEVGEDSETIDLISFIKNSYSTTITSLHTVQGISCGKRLKTHVNLISRGYTSRRGDWPWHAAIFHKTGKGIEYMCGGTLINRNAVLTAAHCLYEGSSRLNHRKIIIKLGLYNQFRGDSDTQEFDVLQIIPHEDFDTVNSKHDIAIIQLGMQPNLNAYVQPVCLWLKEKASISETQGQAGYVIGWGINENRENVENLAEGRMRVVSHEDCLDRHTEFYNQFLSSYTFCGGFRNGTSVCNGDSGGGMFFRDQVGIFRIRGIVSVSKALDNFCNPNEYIIFTNVGRYVDWIQNKISENF